jgi:hypothetical protein
MPAEEISNFDVDPDLAWVLVVEKEVWCVYTWLFVLFTSLDRLFFKPCADLV